MRRSVTGRNEAAEASKGGVHRLPPFAQSLGAVLIDAKESVIAPLRLTLRDYNITEPQWRVMRVINDGAATDATGIAEVSLLRAPSVTRILRELEARKLIVRETDAQDRRRSLVVLSPQGREIVETSLRKMIPILRQYADRFGQDRLDRLAEELRALSAALKGAE
ncbi:MAG: MarR family transcriptional regulator [Sphingomonas sp.]|nr:MarR family transcriptional regulator [Sphingomonas sp.]